MNILILGASYGSLLSTKLLMANHDVSLVCRSATADLLNSEGSHVELKLKGCESPTILSSTNLAGELTGITPDQVNLSLYDFVVLAMQEPQYSDSSLKSLLSSIATSGLPCLSLMNMPPLPFLSRIESLESLDLSTCYTDSSIWREFAPNSMSLCSPDPQAFRPSDSKSNFLRVGLPTNFKAASFHDKRHNDLLLKLSSDIDTSSFHEGNEVPVKLRVSNSLFVPFAKWSMLMCGNYRCVLSDSIRSIKDSVHADLSHSQKIYDDVAQLVLRLGGEAQDIVAFEKYANAAQSLSNPSSVARAIESGTNQVERVDLLIHSISEHLGLEFEWLDEIVRILNHRLSRKNSFSNFSASV